MINSCWFACAVATTVFGLAGPAFALTPEEEAQTLEDRADEALSQRHFN